MRCGLCIMGNRTNRIGRIESTEREAEMTTITRKRTKGVTMYCKGETVVAAIARKVAGAMEGEWVIDADALSALGIECTNPQGCWRFYGRGTAEWYVEDQAAVAIA